MIVGSKESSVLTERSYGSQGSSRGGVGMAPYGVQDWSGVSSSVVDRELLSFLYIYSICSMYVTSWEEGTYIEYCFVFVLHSYRGVEHGHNRAYMAVRS